MTKFDETDIIFANSFLEFVYFNILSQFSRDMFLEKINNIPYVDKIRKPIYKRFLLRDIRSR